MPRILNDDGKSQTIQLDDGQTVVVPSGMSALPLPAPMPTQGAAPEPPAMAATGNAGASQGAQMGASAPPPTFSDAAPMIDQAAQGMASAAPQASSIAPPPPPPKPTFDNAYAQGVTAQQQELAGQRAGIAADQTQAQGEAEALARGQQMQDAANAEREKWQAERNKLHEQKAVEAEDWIKKASEYKIDQNRAMNNMSGGHSIAFWIGAALSGIGQAFDHKSGPNPVLQMMDEKIKQDIQIQQQERDQMRQAGQDKYHALDRFDAFTTDKQSQMQLAAAEQWKRTQNEIAMQRGKTADKRAIANLQILEGQAGQKAAAYAQSAAQGATDRALQERQMRNAEKNTAISGGHLALSTKQFEYGKQRDAMSFALDQQKLDQEAMKLAGQGKVQQAKELREFGMMAPPKLRDGKAVVEPLTNKDGTTWLAPDAETRRKLATKMGATQDFIGQSDELRSLVKGEGAFTKYSDNERFEKAKVLIANMQVSAKKRMEMGAALSQGELDMMNAAIGMVEDPFGLRFFGKNTAALEQGRKLTVEQLNNAMRYEGGYTGDRIDIPDTFRGPGKTEADKLLAQTVQGNDRDTHFEVADNIAAFKKYGGSDPRVKPMSRNSPVTLSYASLSGAQRTAIESLAARARAGDQNSIAAMDQILANDGNSPLSDYARELMPATEEPGTVHNGTDAYPGLLQNFGTPVTSPTQAPTKKPAKNDLTLSYISRR